MPEFVSSADPSGQRWTEAGAFEVAPGVYRVPLPLPMDALRAVNVYVIEDAENSEDTSSVNNPL